jgi:hypothetical protein
MSEKEEDKKEPSQAGDNPPDVPRPDKPQTELEEDKFIEDAVEKVDGEPESAEELKTENMEEEPKKDDEDPLPQDPEAGSLPSECKSHFPTPTPLSIKLQQIL